MEINQAGESGEGKLTSDSGLVNSFWIQKWVTQNRGVKPGVGKQF